MILHYFGITDDTPDEMLRKFFETVVPGYDRDFRREAFAERSGPNRLRYGKELKNFVIRTYNLHGNYIIHSTEMRLRQIERHIANGYPVWISYGPLQTRTQRQGWRRNGHIAVIRGFTANNDIILNDPWGDPTNALGGIQEGLERATSVRGYFRFNIGTGDNTVMRRSYFQDIITDPLNQTLVIQYPHVWSLPFRDRGSSAPSLFSNPVGRNDDWLINQEEQRRHRNAQVRKMEALEPSNTAWFPVTGGGRWHDGIHLCKRAGTPVYSVGPGRLMAAKAANGENSSCCACFAIIRHPFNPSVNPSIGNNDNTEIGTEFYSLYMHLAPVDIAERLRARFSFEGAIETGDWLDQIIQHIQPRRIIIWPETEGNLPIMYRAPAGKQEDIIRRHDGTEDRIGTRKMIFLCPVDDNVRSELYTIDENNEDITRLTALFEILDNLNTYIPQSNPDMLCIFFRENNRWERRYIRRDALADHNLTFQRMHRKHFIYYRRKLAALMRGETVVFGGEDSNKFHLPAESPQEVFHRRIEEVFPEIRFSGTFLARFDEVLNFYENLPSSSPELDIQHAASRFVNFAQMLMSYQENEISERFTFNNGNANWFTRLRGTFDRAAGIISERRRLTERINLEELITDRISFYSQYHAPANVDYHLEVNNQTAIGATDERDLHFEIFSDDCLIKDTLEKYDGNNDNFVLIEELETSNYFDQRHIVRRMREANFFNNNNFSSPKFHWLDLEIDTIRPDTLRDAYVANRAMFQTAITRHLNSHAVDGWEELLNNGNGRGVWEINEQNRANLFENYFHYKFLTREIIAKINPIPYRFFAGREDGIFSTFYHPIRFLAWMDEMLLVNHDIPIAEIENTDHAVEPAQPSVTTTPNMTRPDAAFSPAPESRRRPSELDHTGR